ncbi:MAG TPA: arginine deiminase family protein [Pseudomonadales bacterium]|nr:arginine deiminase family protein [Pseudomonadales bacterium]
MFTHAITRLPAPSLVDGITTAGLGRPDFERALDQHAAYVDALRHCGLDVTVLPALPEFPDSTFVEDSALLTGRCAIVTRPGADSRRGEAELMRPELASRFAIVETIEAPGTLDAGDVMMVEDHFYIGLSERTNDAGAEQLIAILLRHGYTGSTVAMREMLHLKTGVNYLDRGRFLVTGEFVEARPFADFDRMEVPAAEAYAANSLWINGTVLVPAGFAQTRARIAALGYEVLDVDVSEFRKLDGGLSCLSLRY